MSPSEPQASTLQTGEAQSHLDPPQPLAACTGRTRISCGEPSISRNGDSNARAEAASLLEDDSTARTRIVTSSRIVADDPLAVDGNDSYSARNPSNARI